jgi:hypothetical protein
VFRIACQEAREPCAGTLQLRTRGQKAVKLGRAVRFSVPAGTTGNVTVKLSRRAAVRLRGFMDRGKRLVAVAEARDEAGNRTRRSLVFTAVDG